VGAGFLHLDCHGWTRPPAPVSYATDLDLVELRSFNTRGNMAACVTIPDPDSFRSDPQLLIGVEHSELNRKFCSEEQGVCA